MKKLFFVMFVLFLTVFFSGNNNVNAKIAPDCPMGYAIFETNIFGGGKYLVLRCDCAYQACRAWDQQCTEGTILL